MSRKFIAWIEAMRLRTLPVSLSGVAMGCGCAAATGNFKWLPALICLLFALIAQIVSNFANEYFDFKNGLDKKGRDGFRRGVTEGDISPRAMLSATITALAADCLIGLSLVAWGGWQIIPIGVLIALFAMGYSTGPYPLSHHGFGEVAVFIFFGIVPVTLTAWLQGGDATLPLSLPLSCAVGLMGVNVLIVNNYRDVEDDRAVNKKTLAVCLGRNVMSWAYLVCSTIAAAICIETEARFQSWWWTIGPLAYLGASVSLWLQLRSKEGKALNPILGKTAVLMAMITIYMVVFLSLGVA